MDIKHKYDGGSIVLRQAGSTFEQNSGKKIEWEKAVVIVDGTHKLALTTKDAILKLLSLQDDQEFMNFLESLP